MEWYWQGDTRGTREILVPVPLFPPWIPRALFWDRTRASSYSFLFTSCSSCRLETFVYFTGPHVAQAVLVCMRKLLETYDLTGICSYIHFLFFSVLFLVYYYFFYFLAFLCVFCVNICRTSILFCNFNTSDPADV